MSSREDDSGLMPTVAKSATFDDVNSQQLIATVEHIQLGRKLTLSQQLSLTVRLATPAIVAQLSNILMQYIDAAMVGRLGADDSAAVGLVSTSLWLFWGLCGSAMMGFCVLVAHKVGARDFAGARQVVRQGLFAAVAFSAMMSALGMIISPWLPTWLGGTPVVNAKASTYFFVFVAALPLITLNYMGAGMLRSAGNMKVPSAIGIACCCLDVVFNFLFIFPTHHFTIGTIELILPGADLGVLGAALGTVAAEIVTCAYLLWYLTRRQPHLQLWGSQCNDLRAERSLRRFLPSKDMLRRVVHISAPMTLEHGAICGAQIAITMIVAPLGVMAIAANAFGITAESLCYMPGYGIGDAATTLVGQSYGAGRRALCRSFGWITILLGMVVMSAMGILMWMFAPEVMALLSPVEDIRLLGTSALRIEAWAEPMFAAAIVAYGVMVGLGDTKLPAVMNFGSIWLVRLPLAAILAPHYGLNGVWLAMCLELCVRGSLFLWRWAVISRRSMPLQPQSVSVQCK